MKKFVFLLIIFIIHVGISQTLEVVSPNGGEIYSGGEEVFITWDASAAISRVKMEISFDNGTMWYTLVDNCAEKSYRWVAPYIKNTSSQVLIRITAKDMSNPPADVSDAPFTITAAEADQYEPNNTMNEAHQLDFNDTLWGAMTIGDNDSFSVDVDFDYFMITVNSGDLVYIKTFPDFTDTIDTLIVTSYNNSPNSRPFISLYTSSGNYCIGYYESITYNCSESGTYYCRVSSGGKSWHKYGIFAAADAVGSIEVKSPNGGESYVGGDKTVISWRASDAIPIVQIYYSTDNGGQWQEITSYCAEKSYRWVVPFVKNASSQAFVRITARDITNPPSDVSDAPFSISAAATDKYEPNDAMDEAHQLDLNDTLWAAMVMGGLDSSSVNADNDYFSIDLGGSSMITVRTFPDFKDTIDTLIILDYNNYSNALPHLTLYNSTGDYCTAGRESLAYNAPTGGTFYCRVSTGGNPWQKYGISASADVVGTVEIQSPNGGETYEGGDKVNISWKASGAISKVRIEYSSDNGTWWDYITNDCTDKNFRWVIPYLKIGSSQVLVKVIARDIVNPPSDISDAPFAITAAAPDPYEPNNALNEAYQMNCNDTLWGAMTIGDADSNSADIDVDYFSFTVNNGALITLQTLPDFTDTIDTLIFTNYNNYPNSKPFLSLYTSSGDYCTGYYESIIYNCTESGTYYCRVSSGLNIWHKFGVGALAAPWKEVDEIQVNTDDYTISVDSVGDTVYTVKKSGQNTKLDIDLSLNQREQGLVISGILDTNTVFTVPDTLFQVKTISIDAPDVFDASLKYADIVIPYNEDELGAIPESSLAVYALKDLRDVNGLVWDPVLFTHDQVNNKLFVHVSSLNILSVFGVDNTIDIINTPSILPRLSTTHIGYNPRNGFVTIKYQLASKGVAKLEVYNTLGEKVYKIFDNNRKAGYYATRWNVGILSAGIYYFKLTTVNSRIVKKAVVVK